MNAHPCHLHRSTQINMKWKYAYLAVGRSGVSSKVESRKRCLTSERDMYKIKSILQHDHKIPQNSCQKSTLPSHKQSCFKFSEHLYSPSQPSDITLTKNILTYWHTAQLYWLTLLIIWPSTNNLTNSYLTNTDTKH